LGLKKKAADKQGENSRNRSGLGVSKMSDFRWDAQKSKAALLLAEGRTREDAARVVGVADRTLYRWLKCEEFAAEVDRLSVMAGIAAKAERMRITQRMVRAKVRDGVPQSDKDLLEWLKYAQSETKDARLGLADLV
jgi:hypothetical protein